MWITSLNDFVISEPFEGSVEREIGLAELGGTRHQSAAQFVFDQKDAIAIVASRMEGCQFQDGIGPRESWLLSVQRSVLCCKVSGSNYIRAAPPSCLRPRNRL